TQRHKSLHAIFGRSAGLGRPRRRRHHAAADRRSAVDRKPARGGANGRAGAAIDGRESRIVDRAGGRLPRKGRGEAPLRKRLTASKEQDGNGQRRNQVAYGQGWFSGRVHGTSPTSILSAVSRITPFTIPAFG